MVVEGPLGGAVEDARVVSGWADPLTETSATVAVSAVPGNLTLTASESRSASEAGCVELSSSDFVTDVLRGDDCAGEDVADRLARLAG